nr:ribonuclease H-like domain-containing protein [Tanacetum cinerariifolium]
KDREIKYCKKIRGLEFRTESNNECIEILKNKLEILKNEKEGVDRKLASFLTASKDLNNLIESQRADKNKDGLGYSAVPPPPAQIYSSPKKDLSWTGLLEFADDTVTDYSRPSPTMEITSGDDQNINPSVSETEASTSTITPKPFIKFVKASDSPTESKIDKAEKAKKSPVKNFPPVNRKVSTGSRKFSTANRKFPTASRKFPTGSTKCSTGDMGMKEKAIKPSACWFWKPSQNLSNKGPNNNSVSVMFKKYTYIDTQGRLNGCSRHMTENISYLSDYEPFDGGYVSFGQGGCKITSKGTIKTGKLEFENVYFVKDLKTPRQHNMYSIDLNNIVPQRDLTCLVAKASADKCMLWHRRLGHLNFKTTNKLNGVAERRNRTLIKAARTMLADAKLPVTFWAEAVNTACYVQNRVLVNKSHNKTPYELLNGRSHAIGFLKPFGYYVMILNTLDNLGKFEEKGDEGYFIRYSMSSKAFRVFNKRTRRVEENLHVEFLENKSIEKGAGPNWLFDIDSLTKSMNYVLVDACTISTNLSGIKDATSQEVKKDASSLRYIALPNWAHDALLEYSSSKPQDHCSTEVSKGNGNLNPTASTSNPPADQMETLTVETSIPTVSSPVPTTYFTDSQEPSSDTRLISKRVANQEETPSLDNILSLTNRFEDILGVTINLDESNGVEADISNMETAITASSTPTLRIHKDHPKSQIISPLDTLIQTRNKSKEGVRPIGTLLENNAIEKGSGPNWLFDIDSLTKSMNYVPVDAGTISTNLSGTKDAARQEAKKDISSLRYISLPNWAHDALLEFSSSKPQDHYSTEVPKGSRNPNPTASTSNPPADQMETLTVETLIPIVTSPVLTAYSTDSQEPSNIFGGTTNSDESNAEEADISNMETAITTSPTPTLKIHKDHPKSQIISPMDTPIQTRNKSKEVGEQSFIATIHQKTDLALFQFCLFSCFLSQVEPKKIFDALQDLSWVEAMQEELL